MTRIKIMLLIVLLFPVITLMSLTAYKRNILMTGYEVTFPVTGYDPRDLLSGHYVIYTVKYDIPDLCNGAQGSQEGYVCLDNKTFSYNAVAGCQHYIRGVCYARRFDAGIEKFYIPEAKAAMLDKKVRNGEASVVVSVSPDGSAVVKDLLINAKPWDAR